jgi:hypothetical protein
MTYASLIQRLIDEWRQPVTVTEAARLLGIPGSTPAARAQKLRRLERDGVLPLAHRSLVHGDRYWMREELAVLIARRAA